MKFKYSYSIKDFFNKDYLFLRLLFFSMGIINICMSLAVWLGEGKKCCDCSRFRIGVRVIYGTTVFMKLNWSFKRRFVSPVYCIQSCR